ncbi:hypothetical protein N7475_005291 [Penicillium sp. IBT 31633x]|nr:hypothetical protein N7475_005291 [Penicillium sp. IBT 31633x]
MAPHYPLWLEENGHILQNWIENDRALGCPYPISTFTLTRRHPDYAINRASVHLDAGAMIAIGLNIDGTSSGYRKISVTNRDDGPPTWWIGRTGPGVVFIDDIFRSTRSEDPYISEYTKAIYKMNYPLDSLRHVVVPNVNEANTISCVREVYKSREGLCYPSNAEQTWEPCSPEYRALLGTAIGKVVGAFVLCSWGQGRKRIVRIVTFHMKSDVHKLYMRFDLDDM